TRRRPGTGPRGGRGVPGADPGAARPRPAAGVAVALAAAAPLRVRRARDGDGRALRREPGRRGRRTGPAPAGRACGGAAATGSLVSDAGLADRVAGAAACPAGTRRLVGRLAVGPGADIRPAA